MYHNFAELSGGHVLELACGSGRVLLSLAQAGYDVTGIDSSAAMLAIARRRVQEQGIAERCTLLQQDMRTLHLEQKFRMAFIALGSFAHLTRRKDQQQTLAAIRAHLGHGALFILDISNADARYMEGLSGQVLHQGSWKGEDESYTTHFVSPATATDRHLLELTHFYDKYEQNGPVRRTIVTTHLYLFERSEIELLLEQAGFRVREVYGDHDLGPYHLESPRLICVAEAR